MPDSQTFPGDPLLATTTDLPPNISGEIQQAQMLRLRHVAEWHLVDQYIAGDQLPDCGPVTPNGVNLGRYANIKPGQNRGVWNDLQRKDNAYCSLLSAVYPKVQFVPSSAEVASMLKSRATDEAMRYMWRAEGIAAKLHKGNRYLSRYGLYAWHIYFDPKVNCIRWDVVSAYDIFFEKYAASVEESAWVCRRHILRRRDARKMFPDKIGMLDAPLGIDSANKNERMLDDRVELFQLYTKDGIHAMVCAGGVLFQTETPQGVIPIVTCGNTILSTTPYAQGAMRPLLDPQTSLNSAVNSILDTLKQYGRPRLLVPASAEVNTDDLNNTDGPIRYAGMGGDKPSFLLPGQPPSAMFEMITRLQSAMNDLSGIHSSTQGKSIGSDTSGVAVNALVQNDVGQLQNVKNNIEEAFCLAAKAALVYWQTYIPEKVAVSMLDPAMGHIVSTELNSAHFLNNPNVFVEPGSMFASYQAEREQRWLSLLNVKAISPQQYLDLMSDGAVDRDGRKRTFDLFHAQEMLDAVRKGMQIRIFPSDPLKVIAEVFGEFMQTREYYQDAIYAAVEAHDTQDPVHAAEYYRLRKICHTIELIYISVTVPMGIDGAQIEGMSQLLVYPRAVGLAAPASPQLGAPQQGRQPEQQNAGSPPTGQPSPSNAPTGKPSGPVPTQQQTPDQSTQGTDKLQQAIGQAG